METRKTHKNNSRNKKGTDVEISKSGVKIKNGNTKIILIVIIGGLLAIALWKFKFKETNPDGSQTEIDIRKTKP